MDQRIETLSKGFKRRVGLALAILNDPEVLILDEPTDGLDPNQKHEVRELIRTMSAGKVIVLSTHILEEVEAVCTRAMIVAEGSIKFDGTPAELRGSSRFAGAIEIAVASDHGGHDLKSQLIPLLKEMGERPVDLGPDTAAVSVDYPDFASLVAREVSEGRVDLGIIVDGAGIGSAMVANKVPGVLAANCWNAASARNAREHNHANVLTLGSGHLDLSAAREVLVAFLSTAEGEGRHARRNDKTLQVEAAHLRTRQLARTFDEGRG